MSTKLLKCSSCNIVINEVLAFVCNKIDVMTEDSLCSICTSAFTEAEIADAKILLFESTSHRKKNRRGDRKKMREIDDIICLLKETDPKDIPVFVARDLQKLPPVLFDHVDVTRLLKDLVKVQQDVKLIQEKFATSDAVNALMLEIEALKKPSLKLQIDGNANKKRGAFIGDGYDCDSGPMGLSPFDPVPTRNFKRFFSCCEVFPTKSTT